MKNNRMNNDNYLGILKKIMRQSESMTEVKRKQII